MLRNLLLLAAAPMTHTGLTAAPQTGNVAVTTVGTTAYPSATNIYGPFEGGFGSAELQAFGCSPNALPSVPPGIDSFTSEQMIATSCGVELPRVENGAHIGVLDECGYDSDGHFVENLGCLYDDTDTQSGHSTKVGAAIDGAQTGVYGKWEDRSRLAIPALDACNGHFGVTPDSNGQVIYHHHVAGLPPFVIGCFGPADDANSPNGKLVSTQACRDLYPECGDGDYVTVTTSTGSKLYDPYCPCFSGFSNVDMDSLPTPKPPSPPPLPPPPSSSPSPPPLSSSPSPPPPSSSTGPIPADWPGCTSLDLIGDFDQNERATLGDAVHVANGRLEYGSTGTNPIMCIGGDFDLDGSFTLNDAAHVAEAQFGKAYLPWELHATWALAQASGRRKLSSDKVAATSADKPEVRMTMKKGAQPNAVEVHLEHSDTLSATAWKALSVQFSGGLIAAVEMPYGAGGKIITAQHKGSFFQAADLGGSGATWGLGHAATVTFEAGTNMAALEINYGSMNSYVVLQADPHCKPAKGVTCATLMPHIKGGALATPTATLTASPASKLASVPAPVPASSKDESFGFVVKIAVLSSMVIAMAMLLVAVTKLTRRFLRTEPAVSVPTDVKVEVIGIPTAIDGIVKLEPASPRTQTAEKC